MKTICSFVLATFLACAASLHAGDVLKPFPPADDGMKRIVVQVPEVDDESLLKVELLVGKTVKTDGANTFFFGGEITRDSLRGWGFSYFTLKELGPMAGTLMAPPPGQPEVDTFVMVNHNLGLLRYNSRMPIVIYVPEDVEVRYRIWRTDEEPTIAQEG